MRNYAKAAVTGLLLTICACDAPVEPGDANDPFVDAEAAGKGDHIGETFVDRGELDIDGSRSGLVNNNLWNIYDIEGFRTVDFPLVVNAEADDGMEMYMLVFEAGPVEPLMTGRYIGWSGMESPESPSVAFDLEAGVKYRVLVRGLYKSARGRFVINSFCGIADVCEPARPW